MTRQTAVLLCLIGGAAVALTGCESERHLIGDSGLAGSSGVGTGGSAGAAGVAGTGGQGGSGVSGVVARPLVISAREAVRRLAIVIWNEQPDAALTTEADSGTIATSDDVRKLALRMLADPRARAGVGAFYRWWLKLDTIAGLEKDAALFPLFTPELRADMAKETELLGVHVTIDIDGALAALYTSPFSFLTERLAAIYGVAGVTGTAHRKVALDPQQRAGIVTQPGLMAMTSRATRTSPVLRGKFVDEQMLCQNIPPPPPNVPPFPTDSPPNTTTRQLQTSATGQAAVCAVCHSLMDPTGFTLEGLDPIGRTRTTDNGGQVDTSGQLHVMLNGQLGVPVNGPRELAQRLSAASEPAQCFARQWLSFALGRELTSDADNRQADAVYSLFTGAGLNLQQLIAAAVQSDLFLARDSLR
ncbi:MAG TPA: DUF1592 domain-containing protein [Polyangia bacterium]|nr:DUF1592 domain-containing protein [Polyangia bacterium]